MIAPDAPVAPASGWLERSRAAPILAGLVAAALSWWVWGFSVDPLAMVQDENAYRLQAGLFARGRWIDPKPPAELFFDEMHVLSHPVRAAKYPPGHSLALAPGFAARVPAAWPLFCDFASAALLFALARRASGGVVAVLTSIVWLAAPGGLYVRSSYFSELTTGFLWLLGWWALWNWDRTRRAAWLLVFGLAVGGGAITRPLTAIAFALPAGIGALSLAIRRKAWIPFAAATLAGAAALALWPLWSLETTGDARLSPIALYTREVLPWDRPGFGLHDGAARWELPPDARGSFVNQFRVIHARHTPANLPRILADRLREVARDVWGHAVLIAVFALVGAFVAPREARVAIASVLLLFLLYLSYAHWPTWTIYYYESFGVLAYLTGLGLWRCWSLLAARYGRRALHAAGPWLIAATLAAAAVPGIVQGKETHENAVREYRRFAAALETLPAGPVVVFVRYGPAHDPHKNLVVNGPGLADARVWIVRDLGPENARLLESSPERAPFLYDETRHALRRLDTPS